MVISNYAQPCNRPTFVLKLFDGVIPISFVSAGQNLKDFGNDVLDTEDSTENMDTSVALELDSSNGGRLIPYFQLWRKLMAFVLELWLTWPIPIHG